MKGEHPTYPNPTIREALCEIHFALPAGTEWNPLLFGKFYKAIEDRFPEMEPVNQFGIRFEASPSGIEHTMLPPRQTMRYKNPDANLLIQLSEGVLTINVLPVYPGWKQMEQGILFAWGKALDVIRPSAVNRIGLRYINFIPRRNPDETAGDWLQGNDYIPAAALRSLPGFLSRTEVRQDPERKLVVTLGEAEGSPRPIVLDIDCITEKIIGTTGEDIVAEAGDLHTMASSVFFASMTPRLEELLKGVPQ